MQRISIKLMIPIILFTVSHTRINGAAAARVALRQEDRSILEKWKQGMSIQAIDELTEKQIAMCVASGYNELELRSRLWYMQRDAALDIERSNTNPVHAFNRPKWANSRFVLFRERHYHQLPGMPPLPVPEPKPGCWCCCVS